MKALSKNCLWHINAFGFLAISVVERKLNCFLGPNKFVLSTWVLKELMSSSCSDFCWLFSLGNKLPSESALDLKINPTIHETD